MNARTIRIYLGYQSPVDGARFAVWQMDNFNKACEEIGERCFWQGHTGDEYGVWRMIFSERSTFLVESGDVG